MKKSRRIRKLKKTLFGLSNTSPFKAVALIAAIVLIIFSILVTLSDGQTLSGESIAAVADLSATQQHIPAHSDSNRDKSAQVIDSPVFKEFDTWVEQHSMSNFTAESEHNRIGENLAIRRKEILNEIIRTNPKKALENAVSDEYRNRLPSFIAKHLERQVSFSGDFYVYIIDEIDHSTGKFTGSRTEREIVVGDSKYKAFVYGRREAMTTKLDIPLQGIIIGDTMAVDENFVRKLDSAAFTEREIDGSILGGDELAAEVGGKVIHPTNQSELDNFVREQIEWESKIGPVQPNESLKPDELASSWTEGQKTVLFMRVDFSDRPGEPLDAGNQPLTVVRAQNLFINQVNPFYVNGSYNKTSLQATVTPVIRLPKPQTYYTQNSTTTTELLTDARNAARNAGFETNNFNLDILAFSHTQGFSWAGLGYVGGKGSWLNGYFSLRETAHELGHNYGLSHANLWRTTDGTIINQGSNIEYGDWFDAMGAGNTSLSSHFNSQYKRLLDWLTNENVQTVTGNGVYRIFAQDSASQGGIRALKIRKNSTKNYWIEFRQLFTTNLDAMNGATIRWDYASRNFRETQLLDMTPNTSTNAGDAPLLIGQSFLDNENRIRITILGKGNTTPESLDIRVELNVGCTSNLGQTSQNFPGSGGEGETTLNTQSGCRLPATSNSSWIYAFSTDTGAVRYIVAANYDSQPRTGTFIIGGQSFTVQQSASVTACVQSPPNLVAWWRGEGNALDQTGVNNGTLVGEMSFGGGKVGGGFKSDSNVRWYQNISNTKYASVPNSASLSLTQSITFEGWVKMNSYDPAGGTIFERRTRGSGSIGSYQIEVSSNGRLEFFIIYNNNQGFGISTPSNALPLNQFVHFAASRDDATGQLKIYINGSLVSQSTDTRRPNSLTDAEIKIGMIDGITDELSVYNRALLVSEIQAIYNAGTAATGAAGKCLSVINNSNRPKFDFDGDGKTDLSIFRPSVGEWWYLRSSDGGNRTFQFGNSADKLVPADYTGDGKTDIAFFRPSTGFWFVLRSEDNSFYSFPFGTNGDVAVPADYDGDGKADAAVYRPSTQTWFISRSSGGTTIQQFGAAGDLPMVADYDGDNKSDLAIYRPASGQWWLLRSSLGIVVFQFGNSTDKPVQGDYTGDRKADVAFFRPSTNEWFVLRSENASFYSFPFGAAGDVPSPGDYDGDGKTDAAVFRPSTNTWFAQRSTSGTLIQGFGTAGDKPVPNAFVP